MKEDLRVWSAAFIGFFSAFADFSWVEPTLKIVLLIGQVGVTVVTIIYIWSKSRAVWRKSEDDDDQN